MKICVGSAGPFHAFDLARQMQRLGHLEHLYTAYPSWRVDGMPKEKVSTFPWLMAPAMLANRFGFNRVRDSLNVPMIETFDRWMAERIAPCDVFHCLSSFGLQSHRAAQSRHGALTVCDRGSAHIEYQDEILRDEFARFGARFAGIDSRLVERELEEYACCDLIFVPSSFAMRTFVAKGVPRGKLRLNPYGVDLAMFHREPKSDQHISRIVRRHSLASEGNALPVRGDGDAWPDRRRAMRDRRAGSRNASADGEVRWNIPVPRRRRARRVVQTLQSGVGAGAAVDPGRLRNGSSASDGVRGAGDRDRKYRRRGFVQRRRRRFHRSDPRCRCDSRKDSRAVRKSSRCASRWAKRRSRA